MVWAAAQRAHAVELFFASNSYIAALRQLQREWGRGQVPSRQSLVQWVREFRAHGSVAGRQTRSGDPHTHRASYSRLRQIMRRNPNLSIRRLSNRTGIPRSTVQRILRRQLRLFPYKLQLTQRLHRGDRAKRLRFCRWFLGKWGSHSFRTHLLVSDEAHFYLNGQVNKQNCRVWGEQNPHATVERTQHPAYVTVWCGLTSQGIIGPYFFQDRGRTVTVNEARYRKMLDTFLIPELQRLGIPLGRIWFQQDGATPHTTRRVLARLKALFPGKVISKGGDFPWPPRSPDLSPLDFFLWGHLKERVFSQPVHTLRQLRTRIKAAVGSVSGSTVRRALDNLQVRSRWCVRQRGSHLETVITKN